MKKIKMKSKRIVIFLMAFIVVSALLLNLDIGLFRADATASRAGDYCPITFLVPETIYLTPQTSSSNNTFQYYVDSYTNGSLRAPTLDIQNYITYGGDGYAAIKYGNLYFNCPESTLVVISCTGASPALSVTTGTTTVDAKITGGTMTSNIPQNYGTTIKWTATYIVNGKTRTAFAYSYCYAPECAPVAAAARYENTSWDNLFAQSVVWISGVQGYSTTFNGTSREGTYSASSTSLYPLTGHLEFPSSGSHTAISHWLSETDGGAYYYNNTSGTDEVVFTNSPYGLLTIDTSRYNNLNQIPNLSIGYLVSDTENIEKGACYFSDFTGYDNGTNGSSTAQESIDTAKSRTGTILVGGNSLNSTSNLEGMKYSDVWNRSVSGTGTQEFKIKGFLWCDDGDLSMNSCVSYLGVTKVNKANLRNKVRQYINLGLQPLDYTSTSWSAFLNALTNAAQRLGNPAASDTSTTELDNAYNALVKLTYTATITYMLPCTTGVVGLVNGVQKADAADGSTDGFISVKETIEFNSDDSVTFSPNNFNGYTVSSAFGATTSIDTITLEDQNSNISVTYTYAANRYVVTLNYGSDSVGGYGHQDYTSTYDVSTINVDFNHTYSSCSLPTPEMAGWSFGGWYNTSTFSSRILQSTVMSETTPHTIYAKWTPYFSGGHGHKSGEVINGKLLNYDDMFLISNSTDFDRIDMYNSTYNYSTSNGFSYKQTQNLTLN
jgi:uncharacterized repeat protein (TIGR02543 family)